MARIRTQHLPISARPRGAPLIGGTHAPVTQGAWFAAVCSITFLIPYVFTSVLSINHDTYYLIYFAVTLAVLTLYARATGIDPRELFTRSWKLSLALGALSTGFVVWNVLAQEDATARPHGFYFAFEFLWRGIAYGTIDALLLSALPGAVAFTVMQGDLAGLLRRAQYAALTLAMVMVVTATYHLGYEQIRDDGIGSPEFGNTVISVPVLLSANPLGSIVAHASMHAAAVSHAFETDTLIPPQTYVDSGKASNAAPGPQASLTPLQAADRIRTTVTGARPILILNAVPEDWRAEVTADADSFTATYRPPGEESISLSIAAANPPLPGAATVQSQPGFHGDQRSLYQVEDKGNPTSQRFLLWVEPGTWATTSSLGGVPYYLVGFGMTDTEFWDMANPLHPNQI